MPKFVQVYVKATGRKQLVPEHFVDHPVLGAGIALPPSQRDSQPPEGDPSEAWKRAHLDAYAFELGLDTTDLATKADVLSAIEAATADADPGDGTETTDGTESSDETPA